MGTRTLASIEKAVRENNLRGADVGGLAAAAEAHRAALAPDPELLALSRLPQITAEIQEAAARGDVETIERLVAERESIEAMQTRRSEAALEPLRRREAGRPAEGEEADLAGRMKKLEALTARKQGQRDKLRMKLVNDPENTALHAKIKALDAALLDVQPEIDSILERQRQIAEWRNWQAQSRDIAQAEVESKAARKEREKDERALMLLADKAIKCWLELRGSLEQFQEVTVRRMKAAGLRRHCNAMDDARWKIAKATNGAVAREDGISGSFTISGRFNPPEVNE
jgi:hypothetical protein